MRTTLALCPGYDLPMCPQTLARSHGPKEWKGGWLDLGRLKLPCLPLAHCSSGHTLEAFLLPACKDKLLPSIFKKLRCPTLTVHTGGACAGPQHTHILRRVSHAAHQAPHAGVQSVGREPIQNLPDGPALPAWPLRVSTLLQDALDQSLILEILNP